jgi:hypothetical protein
VERVNGHVVERTTAGLAKVPGGVDVLEDIVAMAYGLRLVIGAEGCTASGPDECAKRAGRDQLLDARVVRPDHLARRGDDTQVALRGQLD